MDTEYTARKIKVSAQYTSVLNLSYCTDNIKFQNDENKLYSARQ